MPKAVPLVWVLFRYAAIDVQHEIETRACCKKSAWVEKIITAFVSQSDHPAARVAIVVLPARCAYSGTDNFQTLMQYTLCEGLLQYCAILLETAKAGFEIGDLQILCQGFPNPKPSEWMTLFTKPM